MSAIAGTGWVDPLIKEARERQRRRRRRLLAAVVAVAVGAGGGYGAINMNPNGSAPAPCVGALCAATKGSASRFGALYGFLRSYAAPSTVARVDPNSLQLTGPHLAMSRNYEPNGVSPDGKRLLLINMLAAQRHGGAPALAVVDLATLRLDTELDARLRRALGGQRPVAALWFTPRQLLVVAQRLGRRRWRRGPRVVVRQSLLAVNTATGAIDWRRSFGATLFPAYAGTGQVGSNAVLVLQSSNRQHPQRAAVMTVSTHGVIRSSTLRLVEGGYGNYPAQLVVTSNTAGKYAYVLTGGGVIYRVDATTARTTRHRLALPTAAPNTSPPDLLVRGAALGGNIVVSSFFPRTNGFPAAGVYLIDPSKWTTRVIDPTTPAWFVADDRLLTFTDAGQFRLPASWRSKGTGVRIYDTQGRLRSHLYGTEAFTTLAVTPAFALAVLPTGRPAGPPPQTPVEHRARDRAARIRALVFDPRAGRPLGKRVQIGYLPGLIEPPKGTRHR